MSLHDALTAARHGAAFFETGLDLVELTGADHRRFLNGLVTCDVARLGEGGATYGFCTQVKGRILSDLWAMDRGASLWVEWPQGRGEPMVEHLTKYRIADRVDFTTRDVRCFYLNARAAVALGLPALPAGRAEVVQGPPGEALAVPRTLAGIDWFVVYVDQQAANWAEALAASATPLDSLAWNCLHVESGWLRYGIDFADDCFPQETGHEERAVSYDKGCYLGQEVIARIHYRGGVQRSPRGLRGLELPTPSPGGELLLDGRAVGRLGASTESPLHGPIALAIVHHRAGEPGTVVQLDNGSSAEVVALPFTASDG